mmetsp:Transcript_7495/g.8620  ORF Transcript_7495/g.8620 Transcript_7495/m.8620 type:complete len:149 (-) Transcript_7495:76-522(-)
MATPENGDSAGAKTVLTVKSTLPLEDFMRASLHVLQTLESGFSSPTYPSPTSNKDTLADPAAEFQKSRELYLQAFEVLKEAVSQADKNYKNLKDGTQEEESTVGQAPTEEELKKLENLKVQIAKKNKSLKIIIDRFRELRLCLNSMSS